MSETCGLTRTINFVAFFYARKIEGAEKESKGAWERERKRERKLGKPGLSKCKRAKGVIKEMFLSIAIRKTRNQGVCSTWRGWCAVSWHQMSPSLFSPPPVVTCWLFMTLTSHASMSTWTSSTPQVHQVHGCESLPATFVDCLSGRKTA